MSEIGRQFRLIVEVDGRVDQPGDQGAPGAIHNADTLRRRQATRRADLNDTIPHHKYGARIFHFRFARDH